MVVFDRRVPRHSSYMELQLPFHPTKGESRDGIPRPPFLLRVAASYPILLGMWHALFRGVAPPSVTSQMWAPTRDVFDPEVFHLNFLVSSTWRALGPEVCHFLS